MRICKVFTSFRTVKWNGAIDENRTLEKHVEQAGPIITALSSGNFPNCLEKKTQLLFKHTR